jgi:hypothetical protein
MIKARTLYDDLPDDLGSARLQRAGFGILPKQSFQSSRTHDACAPRKSPLCQCPCSNALENRRAALWQVKETLCISAYAARVMQRQLSEHIAPVHLRSEVDREKHKDANQPLSGLCGAEVAKG